MYTEAELCALTVFDFFDAAQHGVDYWTMWDRRVQWPVHSEILVGLTSVVHWIVGQWVLFRFFAAFRQDLSRSFAAY